MKRDIQTHIDRTVGTEGILRIPSWWMHKILSDLVQYCDSLESSDAGIKEYLESQLNLVGDAVEALDARVTKVESHELFAIVSELPSKPKENTIYLIPSDNGEGNNILTEWVYINDAWEQFGEFKADVDLSVYVKKEEGKGLSTNDYTDEDKEKLSSLENYDDTEIKEDIAELQAKDKATDAQLSELSEKIDNINPAHMLSVTYAELVALRDNGELVAGMQYRITDYVTTTAQENTRSAEHQFDVIVTADDENTLNEVARACLHEGDTYFSEAGANLAAWQIWYSLDNDAVRFAWADNSSADIYDSSNCNIKSDLIDGNTFITPLSFSGYMWNDPVNGEEYNAKVGNDLVYEWGFEEEPNGSQSLVLYKSDVDIYANEGVDYQDKFYYRGVIEVDGEEYDCWQKWEENMNAGYVFNDKHAFALTERIVEGEVIHMTGSHGKGVIYRMIDEWNNDLPYDFKNIMFVRYELEAPEEYIAEVNEDLWMQQLCNNVRVMFDRGIRSFVWAGIADEDKYWEGDMLQILSHTTGESFAFFTFNTDEDTDASLSGNTQGNKMQLSQTLPNNVCFGNDCYYNSFGNSCNSNSFGNYCYYNSFGNDCNSNSFGNYCYYNSFGNDCNSNSFGNYCNSNSFGNYCNSNSFGNYCNSNSFGNYCYYNSFGNDCNYNSFGNDCNSNSFGNDCYYNSFGNSCNSNSFGNDCNSNSFGNYCYYNSFGNDCNSNSFGNDCNYNSFGNDSQSNELKAYYRYITFGEGVQYITLLNETEGDYENQVQNYRVANGTHGEYGNPLVVDVTRNMGCETFIGMDRNDELKVFCMADLIA